MIDAELNLIGKALAKEISEAMLGRPTENRLVLAVNPIGEKTGGGLYIPDNAKNELPKKGVVVAKGISNDDPVHDSINIGDIVLYGKYGGKEINPYMITPIDEAKDLKYFVLSSSEVIFIEPNIND